MFSAGRVSACDSARRMSPATSTFSLRLAVGAALIVLCGACNGTGRFPTCKTDGECAERTTAKLAPLCFELRCVACRSDSDCPTGSACNQANECKRFSDAPPAEGDAGVADKESWEPSSAEDHDRCVAACKGKDKAKECLARCGGDAKGKSKR